MPSKKKKKKKHLKGNGGKRMLIVQDKMYRVLKLDKKELTRPIKKNDRRNAILK